MSPTPQELAVVPLFVSLNEDELRRVASWFDVQEVGEGVRLVGEGAAGYSFFVLAAGTAAVTVAGTDVSVLGPGDFFGEGAILGDGRRTASVTTTSAARLFVLFGTEFRSLQQELPAVGELIEARMRERLAEPVS